MDFPKALRRFRKARGWTQNRFAGRIGVGESEVSRWESGQRVPSYEHLDLIFQELELPEGDRVQWRKAIGRVESTPEPALPPRVVRQMDDDLRCAANFQAAIRAALGGPLSRHFDIPRLMRRIARVVVQVWTVWEGTQPDLPAPMRGPGHHLHMIEALCRNFRRAIEHLEPYHLEILLLGILLHDIGIPLGAESGEPDDLLGGYPEVSVTFVHSHSLAMGFSQQTVHVLENICRSHRAFGNLNDLELPVKGTDPGLTPRRERAILGLIRLADLFDVSPLRITGRQPLDSLDMDLPGTRTLDLCRVYWAAYGDWQRNLFLRGICREDERIVAELGDLPDFHEQDIAILQDNLRHDLQAVLDTVRDVLALDLNCLLVAARIDPPAEVEPDSEGIRDLKRTLIGRLGTSKSPNARQVMEIILTALRRRVNSPDGKLLFDYIALELPAKLASRAFQAPLLHLYRELTSIVDSKRDKSEKISEIAGLVAAYTEYSVRALDELARHAHSHLLPLTDVVVFGYSDCVVQSLGRMPTAWKASTTVTVLEMRNKTVYREDGTTEYADGLHYALKLRSTGFRRLRMASDISLAALLADTLARHRAIPAIVLGINAIQHGSGDALSTIGTQSVARIASSFGVPVLLLAETAKITEETLEATRSRWNCWLTADPQQLAWMSTEGVDIYNPMEDRIPAQFISAVITEEGTWTPARPSAGARG